MDIMVSSLSHGYLIAFYDEKDMKYVREAFLKESDLISRVKELLKD